MCAILGRRKYLFCLMNSICWSCFVLTVQERERSLLEPHFVSACKLSKDYHLVIHPNQIQRQPCAPVAVSASDNKRQTEERDVSIFTHTGWVIVIHQHLIFRLTRFHTHNSVLMSRKRLRGHLRRRYESKQGPSGASCCRSACWLRSNEVHDRVQSEE